MIALPLQKKPREYGGSVFVDEALRPYPDQWAYLASIEPMPPHDIEAMILRATGGVHPLDVTFIDEEDLKEPWKRTPVTKKISGPTPKMLTVKLCGWSLARRRQSKRARTNLDGQPSSRLSQLLNQKKLVVN